MDFEQLVKARHSAVNFVKDFKMSDEDFKKIFDLVKLTPSAYNLQFGNFLVITDEQKKEKVFELSYKQYKIHSASGVVIVLGNKTAIEKENAEKIYSPLKMLKIIDDLEYNELMGMIEQFGTNLKSNPLVLEKEIITNVAFQVAFFILASKHYGFDTCPMHVYNIPELRKEFNIPNHLEPLMMVTIGKSVDKERPRGYRKPVGEFVTFNGF